MARAKKKQVESENSESLAEVFNSLVDWIEVMDKELADITDTVNANAEQSNRLYDRVEGLAAFERSQHEQNQLLLKMLSNVRRDIASVSLELDAHVNRPTRWERIKAWFGIGL